MGSYIHKNSTKATEFAKTPNLKINLQSGQSSLFKTSRSRSIVPTGAALNLRTIDPSIFGVRKNTEIGSIKQLRTHFDSQEQNFGRRQLNDFNTSS